MEQRACVPKSAQKRPKSPKIAQKRPSAPGVGAASPLRAPHRTATAWCTRSVTCVTGRDDLHRLDAVTVGAMASNTWNESCWTFSYLNNTVPPAGTFTGTVRYTMSTP
jgi:hypothetical protein